MAFCKPQTLRNLDVIIEQTDDMYFIYATTNVVTVHIPLQETTKAHLSGVPPKKSLSFIISHKWEALPTPLEENEVPYLNLNTEENEVLHLNLKGHIRKISPLEDRCRTVLNRRFLLTTYGNEMCWLRLFQLVPQPVEVLVPPADRILWQIKLCSCGLEKKNRICLVCTKTSHFRS